MENLIIRRVGEVNPYTHYKSDVEYFQDIGVYMIPRDRLELSTLSDKFAFREFLDADAQGKNYLLEQIHQYAEQHNKYYEFHTWMFYPESFKNTYPRINIVINKDLFFKYCNWFSFKDYNIHPEKSFDNFVCSFNGDAQVGRQLLVSAIGRWGWYNNEYVSKNFAFTEDVLYGIIKNLRPDSVDYFFSLLRQPNNQEFYQLMNSFGLTVGPMHNTNIKRLEKKLSDSFVHLISETRATNRLPHVTEKFLYSVVTRGLFVAFAAPGWHQYLETYHGFKNFTKIFDYGFDSIQCPLERLTSLMCMLSRFQNLSSEVWRDLYEMEKDTIEHNYHHYFSGDYLKFLNQHD